MPQPIVLPWQQKRQDPWEQLLMQLALMMQSQGFQAGQTEKGTMQAEKLARIQGLSSGIFQPPTVAPPGVDPSLDQATAAGGYDPSKITPPAPTFRLAGEDVEITPPFEPKLPPGLKGRLIQTARGKWQYVPPEKPEKWEPGTEAEAIRVKKAGLQPEKPKYIKLGNSIYKMDGDEAKLVKEGSKEERAVMNAMRDPEWIFASEDEAAQAELIEKHKRFLTGETKPAGGRIPLTEADIQYNMKKYKKTRQEVIDAYNRQYGK